MKIVTSKVYRFEKPTINGNRWHHRYEKRFFEDGTFYINLITSYLDPDFNIIEYKEVNEVHNDSFNNYLENNKKHLIEKYEY